MTNEEAIAYGEDYLKDLISACCHIEEKHKDFVRMAIKALEQEPEWIPTSKRLPESVGMYLVTLEYKEHGKAVTTLWYHGEGIGWDLRVADVVVAWMPLLEPYEEGGAKECKALSEWQQDHAILKAHADGANEVIDRIKKAREEVANYSDFHREHLYKTNPNYYVEQGQYLAYEKCLQILNELIAEVEG